MTSSAEPRAAAINLDDDGSTTAAPVARRARLLQGEMPSTTRLDDAMHWMTVYSELVSQIEGIVTAARRDGNGADGPVANGDDITDVSAMRRQLAGYRRRLRYWTGRVAQLHGD